MSELRLVHAIGLIQRALDVDQEGPRERCFLHVGACCLRVFERHDRNTDAEFLQLVVGLPQLQQVSAAG